MKFPRNIKVLSSKPATRTAAIAALASLFFGSLNTSAIAASPSVRSAAATVTASKVAIVTTTRQPSQQNQQNQLTAASFAALQPTAIAAPPTQVAQAAQVIYKLVDAQGRTTYANSPMTGAQKVDLPDLTVMDSQWPSALANATVATAPTIAQPPLTQPPTTQPANSATSANAPAVQSPAPNPALAQSPAQSAVPPSKPVAKALPAPFTMVPVGNIPTANAAPERAQVESVKLILAANTFSPTPQNDPAAPLPAPTFPQFEKLRAEQAMDPQVLAAAQRRRMLESELRQEENLSRAVREALAKEEAESAGFRLKTQELAQAAKKNLTLTPAQKSAKEALLAHFERKRLLQDALSTHERTAEALREVLRAR